MKKTDPHILLKTRSKDKWERIGLEKRAGVLAPLFSVYSKNSLGIGDFGDLKLLVDWAKKAGLSIVQFLPMNDVGPTFCPYDATSSFALDPMYISIEGLPGGDKKVIKKMLADTRNNFPRPPMAGSANGRVDYRIKEDKISLLWEIFQVSNDTVSLGFGQFIKNNSYWINDYALFKFLKDHHDGKPWYYWEARYRDRDPRELKALWDENEDEMLFEIWAQWIAFKQFKEAKEYAASKNVLFKGDLPILISRDSADVWARPGFFKLDFVAGAPPDMYCAKGQRWGMPIYNWENIARDDHAYLKAKLSYAGNFYDILRIDHVVGLFRIWSIPHDDPIENVGLNGHFDPPDESLWKDHGRKLLSIMLNNTDMLLCAEDLGVVPAGCMETLEKFGIPGNDVQRWVKDWQARHDFLRPEEYRMMSVSMLSTHDTTNWNAWWEDEAGTIDEALFIRKCDGRKIDYEYVKERLFDPLRSRHGRLRWREGVDSADILADILGKRQEELADFIEMYENSFMEKEKLWKLLGIKGPIREKASKALLSAVLEMTLRSGSIFCVHLIVDWLNLGGLFKGDPYNYRINTPGTVSASNWSLVMPISLDELLEHGISKKIKSLNSSSSRI